MNSAKLKAVMVEHGDNQRKLAETLGISLSNLNEKINGKTASFRQNEIRVIKDRYCLTADEIDAIFFAL